MATATVDFFYDFASPYACLSALRLRALASAAGVALRYRPFLLGPIFRAEGLQDSPLNVFPLRGAYARRDVARRSRRHGLVVRFPSSFPRHSVLASRVALVALREGWGEAFTEAVFRAEFEEDADIAQEAVLQALVAAQGQAPGRVLEEAGSPEVKAALRAETEAAQGLGIFGAPSFVVAGELFWGDDRLEDALAWAVGGRSERKDGRGTLGLP